MYQQGFFPLLSFSLAEFTETDAVATVAAAAATIVFLLTLICILLLLLFYFYLRNLIHIFKKTKFFY